MVFHPFIPIDKNDPYNKRVMIMEELLMMLPLIDVKQNLFDIVTDIKAKEKQKQSKSFDKINCIDRFIAMRSEYLKECCK